MFWERNLCDAYSSENLPIIPGDQNVWLHSHRVVGGYCHHRHLGGPAVTGSGPSEVQSPRYWLRKQSEANRVGKLDVFQ